MNANSRIVDWKVSNKLYKQLYGKVKIIWQILCLFDELAGVTNDRLQCNIDNDFPIFILNSLMWRRKTNNKGVHNILLLTADNFEV